MIFMLACWVLLITATSSAFNIPGQDKAHSLSPFSVAAYLPEWRFEGANFDTICQHVHHVIFFSVEPGEIFTGVINLHRHSQYHIFELKSVLVIFFWKSGPTGEIAGMDRFPAAHVLADARSAAKATGCKLLICFGGNGRSNYFSAVTRNRKHLKRFVNNVVKLVEVHGLDGVSLSLRLMEG